MKKKNSRTHYNYFNKNNGKEKNNIHVVLHITSTQLKIVYLILRVSSYTSNKCVGIYTTKIKVKDIAL